MSNEKLNACFEIDEDILPDPTLSVAPSTPNKWPPQLVFDLALGLDDYTTLEARYNLTSAQIEQLFDLPHFRQEVALLTKELRNTNEIFKNKAKVQAETYLENMDHLMHDSETPASTKLAIFQTLTKLASLEPAPPKAPISNQSQLIPEGSSGRMIVEWIGGPKDHSPVAIEELKEIAQ